MSQFTKFLLLLDKQFEHSREYLHDCIWDYLLGFEYVVDKSIRSPIFFGSKLEREVMPRKGPCLTSFMRYMGFEEKASASLMTYIARPLSQGKMVKFKKAPRWSTSKAYQPPHRPPSPPPPRTRGPHVPFNSNIYRSVSVEKPIPGPGMYNPTNKNMKIKYHHSFGGGKILIPAVEIKCVPINDDTCGMCHTSCTDHGDYWQSENKSVFLCRACYEKLYKKQSNRAKLHTFQPIRDCSFAHFHERSKNAIKLISAPEIKKRILKEAYLCQYFSKVQDLKYNPGLQTE